MRALPFLRSLLLANLCLGYAAASAADADAALRIGIRVLPACEVDNGAPDLPAAAPTVVCDRAQPYQLSIDGAAVAASDAALALSLPDASAATAAAARYVTVAF